MQKKVLTVLGTRPEAIKLAPVIQALRARTAQLASCVCVTGQHREMLGPFLELFKIEPNWNLDLMKPDQSLFELTASILTALQPIFESQKPDIVLVQGDTTTAFAASLAAFYSQIPVGHVEAGLRSQERYSPFPEEVNRRLTSVLSTLHFAPTERTKENLLRENVPAESIFVTGNTVVDALLTILDEHGSSGHTAESWAAPDKKLILVTGHRRENFGAGLANLCHALKRIAAENQDVEIVYPVHLNPRVSTAVRAELVGAKRIHLLPPLDYLTFIRLMSRAYLIVTDSGGIQEEAPSLGKPVLVTRQVTERQEALEAGAAKLVGTEAEHIATEVQILLDDPVEYHRMATAGNPFGDGKAAQRIVRILHEILND